MKALEDLQVACVTAFQVVDDIYDLLCKTKLAASCEGSLIQLNELSMALQTEPEDVGSLKLSGSSDDSADETEIMHSTVKDLLLSLSFRRTSKTESSDSGSEGFCGHLHCSTT